jgi:serine phosphatase RsbU (regulator of sigma subunit)
MRYGCRRESARCLRARGGATFRALEELALNGAAARRFTNGVPEANKPEEEQFTYEQVVEALCNAARRSPHEIIDTLNARLPALTAGAPQSDDITMICVRRTDGRA